MTTKPAPGEDERWNGLRWVDAKHMQPVRFQEVGWSAIFDRTGPCVAADVPVTDAPDHPGLATRGTFVKRDGIVQPVPAPRLSRTTARLSIAPGGPGARTREAVTSWGIKDIDALIDRGVHVEG